ncbi:glycoside hydrolase family 16 protein [Crepidotus variabilis]|uniref:Glycoside hydrolase family 16 protein n=1 Tax=Crepidotus variabilis TaxID=179855 RepID=A0A9P6EJZ6_9AGAR|nr:glycoside hydrolase family 16 protein [Crepidotus variabilis]
MIMFSPLFFVLALLTSTGFAGKLNHRGSGLRPKHLRHARSIQARNNTGPGASPYKLQDMYQGEDFFNRWDFFNGPDPTHGLVNFQNKDDAQRKKLAYVENGTTVLAVDDFTQLQVGAKRDSIRIQTQKTYSRGLFIADFDKMPHGCSVWPAWWSVGPNWPAGGEIDILEGVHEGPTNQYTLHTTSGCSLGNLNEKSTSSHILNAECASSGTDNRGCAFSDSNPQSYGHPFNVAYGGVFAHLWDNTGIKVWRFSRDAIPQDITSKQPNPAGWGTPAANFPSDSCNIAEHFFEHQLVIDTTLCGDFAGPTFASAGCPGTCEQAVANPQNYVFAKWNINYIAVYDN